MWNRMLRSLTALAGAMAGLLGQWNALLTLLAIAMALDYLTGLLVAWRGKSPKSEGGRLSSAAGFDGLLRKGLILLVVLLATLLDRALGTGATAFQTSAACYYLANEGLSIIENAALMGVPFPPRLKGALEALKRGQDDEG